MGTFVSLAGSAETAGLQRLSVSVGGGAAMLEGSVWYPCAMPPEVVAFRDIEMSGVMDCPIDGDALPLIVMSHGARGWFGGHHDTAEALADAGFVVAAITHPDRSDRSWRTNRPAAIKSLIDHMLNVWPDRQKLDHGRVGFFGFSRGGYTGLVLAGGIPNFRKLLWHCLMAWSDPICERPPASKSLPGTELEEETSPWVAEGFMHDPRIQAAVLAAPLGLVFSADGLKKITIPIQLWRPQNDEMLLYPNNAEAVFKALPNPPDYREIQNAGHFAFLAPCAPMQAARAPFLCTDAPGFDRIAFHKKFNAEIVAFFRRHLKS